jgi:hypothetical protein
MAQERMECKGSNRTAGGTGCAVGGEREEWPGVVIWAQGWCWCWCCGETTRMGEKMVGLGILSS